MFSVKSEVIVLRVDSEVSVLLVGLGTFQKLKLTTNVRVSMFNWGFL